MTQFVVLAEFGLKPGTRERFVELVSRNAAASVADEPGCRRFDVMTPRDGADRVVLYEIYDDEAAFEAHLQTPHFAEFRRMTADLVADRSVEKYDVRQNATP
jgi:quinol monooxygenase YgiN